MSEVVFSDVDMLAGWFEYLDDLRASGEVNMIGAGRYLIDEFELAPALAGEVWAAWKNSFSRDDARSRAERVVGRAALSPTPPG